MDIYRRPEDEDPMGGELEILQGPPALRVSESGIKIFNLPLPPSENKMYPSGKSGMRFKSKELREFQASIETIRKNLLFDFGIAARTVDRWLAKRNMLSLDVMFYFKKSRLISKEGKTKRLDTTNRLKAICDSVSQALVFDDCNFWQIKCSKNIFDDNKEWCDVRIRPFTDHF